MSKNVNNDVSMNSPYSESAHKSLFINGSRHGNLQPKRKTNLFLASKINLMDIYKSSNSRSKIEILEYKVSSTLRPRNLKTQIYLGLPS